MVPKSVALDALLQGLRARIRPAVWAGQHKLAVLSCEEAQKVEWKVSWPVAGGCNLRIRPTSLKMPTKVGGTSLRIPPWSTLCANNIGG